MTLNDFLAQHGAAKKLADKIGLSAPEISRMRCNKKPITFEKAALIEYGTEGAIKIEDLIQDQKWLDVIKYIRSNVSQQTIA
jgi:DNA-binding transcriptional regulator YdaS (Cro superfamily)